VAAIMALGVVASTTSCSDAEGTGVAIHRGCDRGWVENRTETSGACSCSFSEDDGEARSRVVWEARLEPSGSASFILESGGTTSCSCGAPPLREWQWRPDCGCYQSFP